MSGSSRIIIKRIPKYLTESRLESIFSENGERVSVRRVAFLSHSLGSPGDVTDVKIVRAPDGKSRQLAFVGFRSTDEAARGACDELFPLFPLSRVASH